MFTVNRKRRFTDTIELRDGNKVVNVPVEIDLDAISTRYAKCASELQCAERKLREASTAENAQAFGEATIAVFRVLFGDDGTKKMIDFFDGRESEMLSEIMPYIRGEIVPRLQKAKTERLRELKRYHK